MPTSSARSRPAEPVEAAKRGKTAKTRKRRDPLWARLMVILGALLMMTSGGAIVGGKALIATYAGGIEQRDLLGGAGAAAGHNSISGALNILMVGIDQRPDSEELIRADSIIILHVPATHDQAYLISLPRDLRVDIPQFRKTKYGGGTDKINAAFAFGSQNSGGRDGGFELLALTINRLTGIKFNAGAIVDFSGFQQVVAALGGVEMCIDQRVESQHIGYDKNGKFRTPWVGPGGETRDYASTPKVYEVECRHLAAWEALDYVRQRKSLPNGDYDRQRHQQQFIKALMKEAKKQGIMTNPVKAYQLMKAGGDALTVDTNGIALENWAYTMRNVTDNELVMLKTNGGKVAGSVVGGISYEELTNESRAMFEALKAGNLVEFVLQHPHFVNSS